MIPNLKEVELKESQAEANLYSRRSFIKSGTILGVGLTVGLQWLSGCKRNDEDLIGIWEELRRELDGELLMPDFPNYKHTAAPWALKYIRNPLPRAIAKCIHPKDVRTCILWAKNHGIPIVARSGGHSYAGYSTTTGLMIDMSEIKSVSYDATTQLAVVGGGAKNEHIFHSLSDKNVAITHGRCFKVGVAGLTLGGGIGFDMRKNGYTCDKLVETEVVLANGDILVCNDTLNPDLFWACRGAGGGNFGIHTSFTFKTFPVGSITIFELRWDSNIEKLFASLQQIIKSAPDTFGLKANINAVRQGNSTVLSLALLGQLAGSESELYAILSPLFSIRQPDSKSIQVMDYWPGQELISEEGVPEYSHERSRFIAGYLGKDAFDKIIENLNKWPGNSKGAKWKFFLLGGAIDSRSPQDMAMVHRGYTMLSSAEIEYTSIDDAQTLAANEQWLDNFHNEMEPFTSSYCYQNFIDHDQRNYLNAYYGNNLARLMEVKRTYDPGNMFSYPQSIPL